MTNNFLRLENFNVGNIVCVFFLSDLGNRSRIIGLCVSKNSKKKSFDIKYDEVIYRFFLFNPNILCVLNISSFTYRGILNSNGDKILFTKKNDF